MKSSYKQCTITVVQWSSLISGKLPTIPIKTSTYEMIQSYGTAISVTKCQRTPTSTYPPARVMPKGSKTHVRYTSKVRRSSVADSAEIALISFL